MIIDFHTHYYPEALAERALAEFSSLEGFQAYTDGTRAGLEASMQQAGIDISLALPLAWKAENVDGINRWAALHNHHPIYLLGTIHPDVSDPEEVIRKIAEYGLKGIKLHPEFQQFTFDEPRVEKIIRACIKYDIFILTHAGCDIKFPPPPKSNPKQLAKLHQRFPALKLVIAHLGSWGLWDEVDKYLIGLPVYLDLAFVVGYIPDDKLVAMIKRHGTKRIIFGTDSPWRNQTEYVDFINNLPLAETDKENIFWRNAAELLGLAK
jgi:predicted TIM-barrel fold metal-dependent hydrolase